MNASNEEGYLVTLLTTLFTLDLVEKKRRELQATTERQQQVEIAFILGRSSTSNSALETKHMAHERLERLEELGIGVSDELTEKELFHLRGLTQPATVRQVEILKHFKVQRLLSANKTMANYYIRKIFSDPVNVEEWQQRPPTSRIMQGLLFMNGRLTRGMTQYEAQIKLKQSGIEHPARYREWKQIEHLFLAVNDQVTRQRNATRKITWKRFYQYYDEVLSYGVTADEISVEMVLVLIVSHQKNNALLPAASVTNVNTLSATV
ncbi:MAG: hypothetical protein ABW157_08200 [Candidatus Thiodiazotropha sp. LLP2]